MAEIEEKSAIVPEPPHSIAQASVDDKGRLKLPAEFVTYLKAVDGVKVFITTLDFRQVRIYPLPVWKRNASLFDDAAENAGAAERVMLGVEKAIGAADQVPE